MTPDKQLHGILSIGIKQMAVKGVVASPSVKCLQNTSKKIFLVRIKFSKVMKKNTLGCVFEIYLG